MEALPRRGGPAFVPSPRRGERLRPASQTSASIAGRIPRAAGCRHPRWLFSASVPPSTAPHLAGRGQRSPQQPPPGLFQQQAAPSPSPSPSPCPPAPRSQPAAGTRGRGIRSASPGRSSPSCAPPQPSQQGQNRCPGAVGEGRCGQKDGRVSGAGRVLVPREQRRLGAGRRAARGGSAPTLRVSAPSAQPPPPPGQEGAPLPVGVPPNQNLPESGRTASGAPAPRREAGAQSRGETKAMLSKRRGSV